MKIGLIAGSGQFPMIFSKAAKAKGFEIFAVAYVKETDPRLADYVNEMEWMHIGQIDRLIKFFKKNDIEEAVLMGAIKKTRALTDIRPDGKALAILAKMSNTHDDSLLRIFVRVLEENGIKIQASTFLLPDLLAEEGCWTKREPNDSEWADIELGWKMAKEIGRLDVGQCVVVNSGSVLAVEAIDGTDATIRRGGSLGNGGSVVVKVSKPNQDSRFDIPAVGAQTIASMHEAGVSILAIEAGKVVVFDREEMIALADQSGICVVAQQKE
jgi:DUF1009 family protein